jgi:hypothetical protein
MTDTTQGGAARRTPNDDRNDGDKRDLGGSETHAASNEAKDRARDLKDTGREEASRVAHEVTAQTSHLVDETRARTKERVDGQVHHFASMLGDMSGDLDRMAEQSDSSLGSLARDGAAAMRTVSRRLEHDGLDGVASEVRQFARRRPVAFLAGAFAVGLAFGRLVRNTDMDAVRNGSHESEGPWRSDSERRSAMTTASAGHAASPSGFGTSNVGAESAFAGAGRSAGSADVRAAERLGGPGTGGGGSGVTGGPR